MTMCRTPVSTVVIGVEKVGGERYGEIEPANQEFQRSTIDKHGSSIEVGSQNVNAVVLNFR